MAVGMIAKAIGGQALGGAMDALTGPALELLLQKSYSVIQPKLPGPFELPLLSRRQLIGDSQFADWFAKNGFDASKAELLKALSEQFLSPADYVSLWRRGKLPEGALDDILSRLGFENVTIGQIKQATEFLPGPGDIIRFAVREVYSEQQRSELGLDADFPQRFAEEAEKQGITKELARDFWAAHWELPSVSQAFEMFHRRDGSVDKGVIDKQLLESLLKAKDIAPVWRDKFIKISYLPLTRVDVRRMYSIGVMNDDDVVMSYMDAGYSEENARRLLEFTKREYSSEVAGVTKPSIVSLYTKHLITREEATEMLTSLNMSPKAVANELMLADFKIAEEEFDALQKDVIARYNMGELTIEGVRSILNASNVPANYVEATIVKLQSNTSEKVRMPSRGDIERWFVKRIITETRYFEWMRQLGYSREFAQLYLTENLVDDENPKRKFMSEKKYQDWLKTGIMNETEFTATMIDAGYSMLDIQRSIKEAVKDD